MHEIKESVMRISSVNCNQLGSCVRKFLINLKEIFCSVFSDKEIVYYKCECLAGTRKNLRIVFLNVSFKKPS